MAPHFCAREMTMELSAVCSRDCLQVYFSGFSQLALHPIVASPMPFMHHLLSSVNTADSCKTSSLSRHRRFGGCQDLVVLYLVNLRYKIGIESSFPLLFSFTAESVFFIVHYLTEEPPLLNACLPYI